MKKVGKVLLAVALLAGSVFVARAQTVGGAGGPINAQYNIPFPSGTPACTTINPSTFTATSVVAAATSQRLALYVVNSSTLTMAEELTAGQTATRPQDIWLLLGGSSISAAGTDGLGPVVSNLNKLPGIRLRAFSGTNATEGASNLSSYFWMNGPAVPQGAIYAIAESTSTNGGTGSTARNLSRLTVCDFQSQ